MTKRILVFGDSNTWGYTPLAGSRYSRDIRWPARMQTLLGNAYEVVEDGMNGRTIGFEDPIQPYRNGCSQLGASLYTHKPLDLVIVMLGTNDLRAFYNANPGYLARVMATLIQNIRHSDAGPGGCAPNVLLVAPVPIRTIALEGDNDFYYTQQSIVYSRQLGQAYAALAEQNGYAFLNAGDYAMASDADGVHLDAANHKKLATAIATKVRSLLQQETEEER